MTIRDLSQEHKRTNGSIRSRLVKLGRIEVYPQISNGSEMEATNVSKSSRNAEEQES